MKTMTPQPKEQSLPGWALAAALELFPRGAPNTNYRWEDEARNERERQEYRNQIAAIIAKYNPQPLALEAAEEIIHALVIEQRYARLLAQNEMLRKALEKLLDRTQSLDQSATMRGLANVDALTKARAALEQTEKV